MRWHESSRICALILGNREFLRTLGRAEHFVPNGENAAVFALRRVNVMVVMHLRRYENRYSSKEFGLHPRMRIERMKLPEQRDSP